MNTTYRSLALLIAVGVVVQAALIALGVFGVWGDLNDGQVVSDDDLRAEGAFGIHGLIGIIIIPLAALLLLLTAFLVKFDGAVKLAAGVLGLVILQIVLAQISFEAPFVGALHAINAFLIAGAASAAAAKAKAPKATDATVATTP